MLTVTVFNATTRKTFRRAKIQTIVEAVLKGEKIRRAVVNVVLVDDATIHEMNREYLQHDYPTDVITFSLKDSDENAATQAPTPASAPTVKAQYKNANMEIDGEIYISVETAQEQAAEYAVTLTEELMRLAAHGALHLAGYDDATDELRQTMHEEENRYLQVMKRKDRYQRRKVRIARRKEREAEAAE
jgi:probable rRNA maturation factor